MIVRNGNKLILNETVADVPENILIIFKLRYWFTTEWWVTMKSQLQDTECHRILN